MTIEALELELKKDIMKPIYVFYGEETYLLENCVNGDLLITMGAGDVYIIGEKLLGK